MESLFAGHGAQNRGVVRSSPAVPEQKGLWAVARLHEEHQAQVPRIHNGEQNAVFHQRERIPDQLKPRQGPG